MSRKVPLWNFVAVTRSEDGVRFYIKLTDKNKFVPKSYRPTPGSLIKSFNQLKEEAEEIVSTFICRQ